MKRIYIILTLSLIAVLVGCGRKSAAGFYENDLVLNISGNAFNCREDIQTVIDALGEGYGYAEGKSCNYDGLDKTYIYEDATFYTHPLPEGDMISEIYTDSAMASTSKGISVGADKADVLAAYGEPETQDEYLLIYRVSSQIGQPSLCFALEGNTVVSIYLTLEAV